MNKAVVLSSGGIDSTTCLAVALNKFGRNNVCTVSIWYGQKHSKELESAKKISQYYQVPHYELNLSEIFKHSNCSLLQNSTESIPDKSYAQQIAENGEGKVSTYVPFRNGLMLSAVASLALSIYPNDKIWIYIGAHADDAAGEAYPDCSPRFVDHMSDAIYYGSGNQIEIAAPFVNCNKAEVVKTGITLNVPYELTWSCYKGGEYPCHTCGTCIDRETAFKLNGVSDPLWKEGK